MHLQWRLVTIMTSYHRHLEPLCGWEAPKLRRYYWPFVREIHRWPVDFPLKEAVMLLAFLHSAHLGRRLLSCPALSVRMSVRPPSLALYNTQYLTDSMHIRHSQWPWLEHEPYWLWGYCVHFQGAMDTLKFYEYTDWLASWSRPAGRSRSQDSFFSQVMLSSWSTYSSQLFVFSSLQRWTITRPSWMPRVLWRSPSTGTCL